MREHAGRHLGIFDAALREQVRQSAPPQPRQEGGEIAEEDGPGRAVMDFEPVDVGSRPLADEPARHERALPDPRDARDDQEGGGRIGPCIEGVEPLHAAEDAAQLRVGGVAARGEAHRGVGDMPPTGEVPAAPAASQVVSRVARTDRDLG